MGWRYRKSINLGGGFRINLSKSGIGYSWGTKGYRVTKMANGSVRKTYSIPGTGISYVDTKSNKKNTNNNNNYVPKVNMETLTIGDTTYYKSENLDEMSKNDIVLQKIRTIHKLNRIANILCYTVFFLPVGLLLKLIILLLGRIKLEYEFDSYSKERYDVLNSAIEKMRNNYKMWRVDTSVANADVKYHGGASSSITRSDMNIYKGTPWYITSNINVYYVDDKHKKIYLTPDRIIIIDGGKVYGSKYNNLDFSFFNSTFVEDGYVPKDAKIVGETWKYVNKSGGPDRRFSINPRIPICDYGGLSITSSDGINFRMQCSNLEIMAEVQNLTFRFVEIVNQEAQSEDVYYNFEEADENVEESGISNQNDNENEKAIPNEEYEEINKNQNTDNSKNKAKPKKETSILKMILSLLWLVIELFLGILFAFIAAMQENMTLSLLLWLGYCIFSYYIYKNPKKIYRIINIFLFIVCFVVLIMTAPKKCDGIYTGSDNNTEMIIKNYNVLMKYEDGSTKKGRVKYENRDEQHFITIDLDGEEKTYLINENVLQNDVESFTKR